MDYQFMFQASAPRYLTVCDPQDETLGEAVESVFPLDTEYAFMAWNWVYVPLSYKYDLAIMLADIVAMLDRVLSFAEGEIRIQWPSNTFAAEWRVKWKDGMVHVHATWRSVLGSTEDLLGRRPDIHVLVQDFVSEWQRPLEIIVRGLRLAGYDEHLSGLHHLEQVIGRIRQPGQLYRE